MLEYFPLIHMKRWFIVCIDCQVLPSASAMVLGDVKSSLDKEAADLDRRRVNMSTGSKLLKEKEWNLKQLETSLLVDEVHICHAFSSLSLYTWANAAVFDDRLHS